MALALIALVGSTYLWYRATQVLDVQRYAPVIEAMKNHKIPTDEAGRVDLTRQFPGVTAHNDAYITYRFDGTFIVMFPTYYGQGQQVGGLLYTSRPLKFEDTHERVSAVHFAQRLIKAGSYDHLLLEKKLNENWYEVTYRIH